MAFLGHLCIIISGIYVFGFFIAYPRSTTFFVVMMGSGYLGSSDGFFGTVFGLLIGAVLGGVGAGLIHGASVFLKFSEQARLQQEEQARIQEEKRKREAEMLRQGIEPPLDKDSFGYKLGRFVYKLGQLLSGSGRKA